MVIAVGTAIYAWLERRWDRGLFRSGRGARNLSVREARALLDRPGELEIWDVRPAMEGRGGGLPGAIRRPVGSQAFREAMASADRSKPVLVYCTGGFCSRIAVGRMQKAGFDQVHHLKRGYLGWLWDCWRSRIASDHRDEEGE